MSDALVIAAFETRIEAWAAAQTPAIPVAFHLVDFEPPATRYIRAWVLPARTLSKDWAGDHRLRRGIFQVDLCLPLDGSGKSAITALAASLDVAFPMTGPMTQGAIKVYLLSPMSQSDSRTEGTHSVTSVSCEYNSHTV